MEWLNILQDSIKNTEDLGRIEYWANKVKFNWDKSKDLHSGSGN